MKSKLFGMACLLALLLTASNPGGGNISAAEKHLRSLNTWPISAGTSPGPTQHKMPC